MSVDLDVLLRLGQLALIVAGVLVLIYLAVFFKELAATARSLTRVSDELKRDLEQLQAPLATVDSISRSVDEVGSSAKKAAMSAINNFSKTSQNLTEKMNRKKAAPSPKAKAEEVTVVEEAEFVPIAAVETASQSMPESHSASEDVQ